MARPKSHRARGKSDFLHASGIRSEPGKHDGLGANAQFLAEPAQGVTVGFGAVGPGSLGVPDDRPRIKLGRRVQA